MKPSEVRDMSADQLSDKLLVLRKEQMDSRFELASGQLKSTRQIRRARRDIARIKTEINVRKSSKRKQEAAGKTTDKTEGERTNA